MCHSNALVILEELLPLKVNSYIGHMKECPLMLRGYPKYESPPCSLECAIIRSVVKILRRDTNEMD